jgi:hypothetical protein
VDEVALRRREIGSRLEDGDAVAHRRASESLDGESRLERIRKRDALVIRAARLDHEADGRAFGNVEEARLDEWPVTTVRRNGLNPYRFSFGRSEAKRGRRPRAGYSGS